MTKTVNRRDVMKAGLSGLGLAALGRPLWSMQAGQGEVIVPFTDFPANYNLNPRPGMRYVDTRTIDAFITPTDQFYAFQHYTQPDIDMAAFRLKVTGMVSNPREYTVDELRRKSKNQEAVAFECSGNTSRGLLQGMVSNGLWTGVNLSTVLKECGVLPNAKEIVFFGADSGAEDITHGGQPVKVDQNHFARSLSVDDAMKPGLMLAYDLNGAPLPKPQGAPLRLINPGWHGVAQVKWLQEIRVQDTRYMGRFMARDYVTLRGKKVGDTIEYTETSVSRIQLKSVITRVTKLRNTMKISGFALNDTTPLKAIEVRIDGGPWRPATIDKQSTSTSWKLFSLVWEGATPGEHSLVSRAIDIHGQIQPETADELKKTRWENNEQWIRKVMVS